jgi:hypothetical protein
MSKKWEEEAAYYEAHRNDPEMWGEPIAPPVVAPRDGLAISITVRFSPQEAEAIRRTARVEGKNYSEVVRAAVRQYTQPDASPLSEGEIHLTGMGAHNPRAQPAPPPSAIEFDRRDDGTQTISTGISVVVR